MYKSASRFSVVFCGAICDETQATGHTIAISGFILKMMKKIQGFFSKIQGVISIINGQKCFMLVVKIKDKISYPGISI